MLYYTVTHNVSCDGSELAFNTTTNKAILNGTSYEETYYISVCAINAIGKGKITTITGNNLVILAKYHYLGALMCMYNYCDKLIFVSSKYFRICGTIKQNTGYWFYNYLHHCKLSRSNSSFHPSLGYCTHSSTRLLKRYNLLIVHLPLMIIILHIGKHHLQQNR